MSFNLGAALFAMLAWGCLIFVLRGHGRLPAADVGHGEECDCADCEAERQEASAW